MKQLSIFASILFTAVSFALAQQTSLEDVDGTWYLNSAFLPGQVYYHPLDGLAEPLTIPLQGLPEDNALQGYYDAMIGFQHGPVAVDAATGTAVFTPAVSSDGPTGQGFEVTVSVTEAGQLKVTPPDDAPITFVGNEGRNMMVSISRNRFGDGEGGYNYDFDLELLTRVPETLAVADLAGDWIYQGAFLLDVFNDWEMDPQIPVTVDVSGNGSAEVPGEGTVTFTAATGGQNGAVTLDFGGETETYYINATKDVMVRFARQTDGDFNPANVPEQWGTISTQYDYSFVVLVRKPDSLTLEDLAGTWIVQSLYTDAKWFATDPYGDPPNPDWEPTGRYDWAGMEKLRVKVNADGMFRATVSTPERDNPGDAGDVIQGTVRIEDNMPVFIFSSGGQTESLQFALNAAKDFMYVFDAETSPSANATIAQDMIFATKKPTGDLTLWEEASGAAEMAWLRLDWFGNIYLTSEGTGWAYHAEHGWIYVVGRSLDGFWIWFPGVDLDGGEAGTALWTNASLYPYFLRSNPGSTSPVAGFSAVYYARFYFEETGELWFYDFAGEDWFRETPMVPPAL